MRPTLEALVTQFNDGGWPAHVEGDAVHRAVQRAERRATALERSTASAFDKVIGVATAEPHGATRWRFV